LLVNDLHVDAVLERLVHLVAEVIRILKTSQEADRVLGPELVVRVDDRVFGGVQEEQLNL